MTNEFDAYLLTFDTTQLSRDKLVARIDRLAEIANWYAFLPAGVILISRLSASELSDLLRESLPDLRFLVAKLEKGKRQGWLPKSAWQFINDPHPAENMVTAAE